MAVTEEALGYLFQRIHIDGADAEHVAWSVGQKLDVQIDAGEALEAVKYVAEAVDGGARWYHAAHEYCSGAPKFAVVKKSPAKKAKKPAKKARS